MITFKRILLRIVKYFFISVFIGILLVLFVPYFANTCRSTNDLKKFDVIIVLGNPATNDCKPSSIMKNRVEKGAELFNLGFANKILFTGSSVRNNCTEADVMTEYAISKGISKLSIIKEQRAVNTYQNAYYSVKKMKKHNFNSAAIVTSSAHLKRACAVFSKFDITHTMFATDNLINASKTQIFLWNFGERMILTHQIIFGYPK